MKAALTLVTSSEPDRPHTSGDIIRAAGITRRLLGFWVEAGYLTPGPGNRWPASELEAARKMGLLTRARIPASLAAEIARSGENPCEIAPRVRIEVTP